MKHKICMGFIATLSALLLFVPMMALEAVDPGMARVDLNILDNRPDGRACGHLGASGA